MIKLSDHLYIEPMGRVLAERDENRRQKAAKMRREYAGAKLTRLNKGWTTQTTTANYELRQSLASLRARSRQMCRDEALFKRFLKIAETNVIGSQGIQLQCRAYLDKAGETLNAELNKRVQDAFWLWGQKETCSVSGKLDWIGYQNLFMRTLMRDGEVLIAKVYDPSLPWGFALKFIDVSYLDETFNETQPNGNRVIMSVEVDVYDRPIAYWLTTPASDINFTERRERRRTRVAAEQMIHSFIVADDEAQTRGVPQFHAVMVPGKNLGGYNEGVITSARATANWVGFITQEATDDVQFDGEEDEETGLKRDIEIDNSPGQFNLLDPGMKVDQIDPKQPTQNHTEFKKGLQADIATGLDIPYFVLTGDLSAVNYSSARVGLLEFRDMCRGLQTFVATHFCREVYHSFVPAAVMAGELRLNAREFAEIQNPTWRPRGWQFVDPQKEIKAAVEGLKNNILSLTKVKSDTGEDIEEHFQDIQRERKLAEKYEIDLEYDAPPVKALPAGEPDDDEDPAGDGKTRELLNGHAEFVS